MAAPKRGAPGKVPARKRYLRGTDQEVLRVAILKGGRMRLAWKERDGAGLAVSGEEVELWRTETR